VLLDLLAVEPQLLAARPARASPSGLGWACSARCGSWSSRSTTPSRASSTWNATVARTPGGVAARVLQRILALVAAIWHNDHIGQPTLRSLVAYDH
jgi:hypothetical protein